MQWIRTRRFSYRGRKILEQVVKRHNRVPAGVDRLHSGTHTSGASGSSGRAAGVAGLEWGLRWGDAVASGVAEPTQRA